MKTAYCRFAIACILILLAPLAKAENTNPRVLLETTQGNILLELNTKAAPATVENFIQYVDSGFYNGTIFHRVISDFMIQGGGFTQGYSKKETRAPIKNEADNGLKNNRGTIAMARTQAPHSATAQFFINVVDNDFLNHSSPTHRGWGYAVFGEVIEGMEVVDKIRQIPTGSGGPFRSDVPKTAVVIEMASVVTAETAAE